jgi:septal ring factor EnvC (AmiA/AmiB activator)
MTVLEMVQIVTSVGGVVVALGTAWFVFLGSDRASKRNERVQEQTNDIAAQSAEIELFKALTQGQREELNHAHDEIKSVRRTAAAAQSTAERCQHQVDVLTTAYRDLREWAYAPCPHTEAPPDPPQGLGLA